jgi:hypothetical protein
MVNKEGDYSALNFHFLKQTMVQTAPAVYPLKGRRETNSGKIFLFIY